MKSSRVVYSVVILLLVQGLAVHAFVGVEHPPLVPDLGSFPRTVGSWQAFSDNPLPAATAREIGADQTMARLYIRKGTATSAELFVAWFQSQRGGATQPHSPKVCLPGSGWLPEENRVVRLETSLGPISANRYIVANRGRRALVLYWYQTPRRVISSEWAAKFFTVADGLRDRRTDTAVVRVFISARPDGGETEEAENLASAAYPLLRDLLPR